MLQKEALTTARISTGCQQAIHDMQGMLLTDRELGGVLSNKARSALAAGELLQQELSRSGATPMPAYGSPDCQ